MAAPRRGRRSARLPGQPLHHERLQPRGHELVLLARLTRDVVARSHAQDLRVQRLVGDPGLGQRRHLAVVAVLLSEERPQGRDVERRRHQQQGERRQAQRAQLDRRSARQPPWARPWRRRARPRRWAHAAPHDPAGSCGALVWLTVKP